MEKFKALHEHFNQYVDEGKLPGYLVLITQGGEEVNFLSYGMMDIERNKPIERDTIFRIYSMSKPITSVALMMLHEKGLFQLDDPVEKYIPSWKSLKVYHEEGDKKPNRPMTIKDLLIHTSGLTYDIFREHPVDELYRKHKIRSGNPEYDLKQMVEKLADLPLRCSPGEEWNYSFSTYILGYLIEQLSGEKLNTFFQKHIFTPLGMVDTDFYVPKEKIPRFAANYEYSFGKSTSTLMDDPEKSAYLTLPKLLSGGGGLVSTIDDYNKFTQMLLNKDTSLLESETIELMTINHLPEGKDLASMGQPTFNGMSYKGVGFGLGFSITGSEYSWGGAASTTFFNDPEEELSVIFMTQAFPSWIYPIKQELKQLVYRD